MAKCFVWDLSCQLRPPCTKYAARIKINNFSSFILLTANKGSVFTICTNSSGLKIFSQYVDYDFELHLGRSRRTNCPGLFG